jgi:hypothetical protein
MGSRTDARRKTLALGSFLCATIGVLSPVSCVAASPISQEPATPAPCATAAENPHHRAGHPDRQACYAQPSNENHYSKGYVGGGTQFHGSGRFAHQGTWGRDYCGSFLSHRPWLHWSHGRRHQGGSGAYKTDGPKFLGH